MKTISHGNVVFIILISIYLLSSCKTIEIPASIFKPPKISMSLTEREIEKGGSITIRWDAPKATHIKLLGMADSLQPKGEIVITPDTTQLIKFTAFYKNGEKKSQSRRIKVFKPNIRLFSLPDSATDEVIVPVSWIAEGAKYVHFIGMSDSLPVSGTINVKFDTTMVIGIVAEGDYSLDSVSKQINIKAIEEFRAVDYIYRWDRAMITWKMKYVDKLWIDGYTQAFNAVDTLYVEPHKKTIYSLNVLKTNGDLIFWNKEIDVKPPEIKFFRRNATIMKNEKVVFTLKCLSL